MNKHYVPDMAEEYVVADVNTMIYVDQLNRSKLVRVEEVNSLELD